MVRLFTPAAPWLLASMLVPAFADAGEVTPAPSAPCFPGAYYRKALSSLDQWSGIEAIVKLPEPSYDMTRTKPSGRPKDNASIYLGGNCDVQEIDCGVSWEVIQNADGEVSTLGKAFRPFWRNENWGSGPAKTDYYYYPGDVIRMLVQNTEDGKILMRIDLLARAGSEKAKTPAPATSSTDIAIKPERKAETGTPLSTVPVDSISSFTTVFDAAKFNLSSLKQFKRVNGLDQSGNEGQAVQLTTTKISNAEWKEVYLIRDNKRYPMTPERFTDMRCPDPKHIQVSPVGESGEQVTLTGTPD